MAKTKTTHTRRPSPDTILRPVAGAEPIDAPPIIGTVEGSADDRVERISIPLTADGKAIDWERMRPRTQDQLRGLLGGATPGAATGVPPMDPAVVGMLYGSLGMLMVSAARAKGYTDEQARVLIFTPEEKAALAEPTGKLLAKYTGALGRWQEELVFATMLGTVMAAKIGALRKTAPVINMVREDVRPTEGDESA